MTLNGSDIAGYIKERQARDARRLKQSLGVQPKLVILQVKDDPTISTYVRLKKRYGQDIGVDVEVVRATQTDLLDKVKQFNIDETVHGIIVQLPIDDASQLDTILNSVEPSKDVDGLGAKSKFDSATATAIMWLLAGYNIDLRGRQILVVGQGRLVGVPLTKILQDAGHNVQVADTTTKDLSGQVLQADIVVTATGSPRLIKSDWLKPKAVVVDAGTASESGEIVGDLDESVYTRMDIKVTPQKGGVGPLTVCSLFDNLLRAASKED